jgi:DNA-binding MarR family transcriptional regulator/GNAT superfamily N-acetyltransferase
MTASTGEDLAYQDQVAAVRAFNRFYTNVIGLVHGMYLDMPYSLTEARLLFELSRQDSTAAADLRRVLDIDAGYLSRVLARFEADGLVGRQRSGADARRHDITLTSAGRDAAAELDARSARQIGELLAGVDRRRLLGAMREITDLLGRPRTRAVVLRPPATGDLGWVLQRHGVVYAEEFGWNRDFETWVAAIIAGYLRTREPARQAGWIAEVDGVPAGSVFCVPENPTTARLRMLLVERWARGLGLGARLVEEVLRFARQAGYQRIVLSTYDVLVSAGRIYKAAGFTLVSQERERAFGHDLNAQTWARDLSLDGATVCAFALRCWAMPSGNRGSRQASAVGVDRLEPGDHAFLAFTNDDERWHILGVFAQQGLARDEKVLLLVDTAHAPAKVAARVSGGTAAARRAVGRGQLVVSVMPRLDPGGFAAGRLAEVARHTGALAGERCVGLRCAAEMAGALTSPASLDRAVEFETALHQTLSAAHEDRPYTSLCHWDEREFGGGPVMDAVRAIHPVTLLDRDGTLHVTPTASGIRLTGDSDLCTRAEFDAALGALAGLPHRTLVLDITDLSFLDACSAGTVLRLAAGLTPPRRLEVLCRNHHRRMLHLLGGRPIRQLSIVTVRI